MIIILAVILLLCFVGYIAASFFSVMSDNIDRRVESSRLYEQWLLTKSSATIFITSGKKPELKTNVNMNIRALDISFSRLEEEIKNQELRSLVVDVTQQWYYTKFFLLEIVSNENSYRNFEEQIFWLSNDTNSFGHTLRSISTFLDDYHKRQLNMLSYVLIGLLVVYFLFTFLFVYFFNKFSKAKRISLEYKRLLNESLEHREDEKRFMVLEIHDTVIQDMVYSRMLCKDLIKQYTNEKDADKLRTITDMLAGTLQQLRDISYGIRPPELEKELDDILSDYVANWDRKTGRLGLYSSLGLDSVTISKPIKLNVYRIVQELLTNIEKHSDATEVKVNLIISWPNLLLKVSDNGSGFDLESALEVSDGKAHSGLKGMMERVRISRGTIKIKSSPEKGTAINISIPLEDRDE